MEQNKFKNLTDSWLEISGKLTDSSELKGHIEDKISLSENIYNFISPIASKFTETNLGQTDIYGKDLTYGLNINRLLKSKSLDKIDKETAKDFSTIVANTFSYGILTHLFLFNFPSRGKYSGINLNKLEKEWIVESVVADRIMGYYGNKRNPICMDIFNAHFKDEIKPLLKQRFGIGIFRMGSFKSYFKNLYIAGALLIMKLDMSTKKI